MAKKKLQSTIIPDLFSDFDAPGTSAQPQAQSQAPVAEQPGDGEPETPATQPESVGQDVDAAGAEPSDTLSDDESDDTGEEAPSESSEQAAGGLPPVLSDGIPPNEGGQLNLARYASRAYLEYALSVVKSRALPDVFDGLKPVQRRILFAMDRMHLSATSRVVKSARVVGDVLGKYHPHGDQAAYEAMVRMTQDFSLRYPLVDGIGNFGSRDGDGAAAMRYTEARLTKISELLLEEIDSEDVPFVPNYDGSFREPTLLPAKLPFVLLNGASGIAVGLATEIPSHNLTEVGQAVLLLLDNPQASLEQVMQILPAPDFPGGGQIITPQADIRSIYSNGRGVLKVRARYHFEEMQRGQWQLVVDELPPATNAEAILSQIEEITNPKPKAGKRVLSAEQQQNKANMLALLENVRNECDKDTPMRLVFEPKTSKIDRKLFVNVLLAQTALESNAPVNLVMIGIDGRPRQKGLLSILSEWIEARTGTVRLRTQARLEKVNARLHIIEGRLVVFCNLDRVIEIVRYSDDAKADLMKEFSLSDTQAEDILELRLRQLSNLTDAQLKDEQSKLMTEKRGLERILSDETVLRGVVARETRAAITTFGDARRTLVQESERAVVESSVVVEPVTVVISQKGYVRSRTGHGHDASLLGYKIGDALWQALECMSDENLIAIGHNGRVYSVPVASLPGARGDGLPLASFIDIQAGTDLVGFVAGAASQRLVLANDEGFGLVCTIADLVARVRSGKAFMKLSEQGRMLAPQPVGSDDTRLACLSEQGRLLVFELSELRTLNGGGKGVTLMGLNAGEKMIDALPCADDGCVISGQGRSCAREKTLTKGGWAGHFGKRSRKGKPLEIRFTAQAIHRVVKDAAGTVCLGKNEDEADPTIF